MALEAIIVDDEDLARERIRTLLGERPDIQVKAECRSGHEAIAAIERHAPDLVFLDVQMPDLDGFGVIERVGAERMPPVIFVTAFDRYAVDAFETSAVDYLLKPFDRRRFERAVARALERLDGGHPDGSGNGVEGLLENARSRRRYAERIAIRSAGSVYFVKVEDIDYVEAARNYVHIHCGAESHRMRATMTHVESRLDPEIFLRIHRSTLVNLDRVRKIEPGYGTESIVELEDGTRLIMSRAYRRGKLRQLLS